MPDLIQQDLEYIQKSVDCTFFHKKRIFVTGGTGFFGKWMLESFRWIINQEGVKISVIVLSRDPERFLKTNPSFARESWLSFLKGDIRSFEWPEEHCDYMIHGAADAGAGRTPEQVHEVADVIEKGTERVLKFAAAKKPSRVLFLSSGAVYGTQPQNILHVDESYHGKPDTEYGRAKLSAERLCCEYASAHGFEIAIARCFAFIGPFLPLGRYYAAGNFLQNILDGKEVLIKGNGRTTRSYLYMSDLVIWLFKILQSGISLRPYNVGSDQRIEIADLAKLMVSLSGSNVPVRITNEYKEQGVAQYVPCIERAKKELNLKVGIGLEDAIRKMIEGAKYARMHE
ncbi:MAG TPA: NAD(P)-dependent oxidoreductase [Candidatus Omnitrophota bacterium]|nr:NAD(P)-dependent oxidoreductase [Candidatus Omnitrophota bacterium]